jgi:predicted O-methyltransferase YrrM
MQIWTDDVARYIADHTAIEDPLLREMEQRARRDGFPIIGPVVGPWLYSLTRTAGAQRVFEMGSGFGYSTWYFATALRDGGGSMVTHTVWDQELSDEAQQWLERAGLLGYCDFVVSESTLALAETAPGLDVIFMDIDKEGYSAALKVIEQKLRPGGLLLVDNVLWNGRVTDEQDSDEATVAIRQLNEHLNSSEGWDYLIVPLRDGLGVARRRG